MKASFSGGGFTELTLDPAEWHGKTRVGGDRDGASGCLPGLRRGGADQVGPRLRPAALAVRGLRPAGHAHHPARQTGGDEGRRGRAVLHRPVAERDRQAPGRLGSERDALGQGPRPGALPQAGADRAGGRGRDRRGLARRPKKAGKLWIWKALERGTGRLIDWEAAVVTRPRWSACWADWSP